jgi:hypothetical protein
VRRISIRTKQGKLGTGRGSRTPQHAYPSATEKRSRHWATVHGVLAPPTPLLSAAEPSQRRYESEWAGGQGVVEVEDNWLRAIKIYGWMPCSTRDLWLAWAQGIGFSSRARKEQNEPWFTCADAPAFCPVLPPRRVGAAATITAVFPCAGVGSAFEPGVSSGTTAVALY